jgi:hypothetical protein
MIFYHEQHYFRLKYNEHIDIGAKKSATNSDFYGLVLSFW